MREGGEGEGGREGLSEVLDEMELSGNLTDPKVGS